MCPSTLAHIFSELKRERCWKQDKIHYLLKLEIQLTTKLIVRRKAASLLLKQIHDFEIMTMHDVIQYLLLK